MTLSRAEPIFFGPDKRPLFGWLHAPSSTAPAGIGLVICNPFGYEAVCAHRSLKHFATSAAVAGIPALRFDYDGTGDSAGDDFDPERLQAWIRSIHDAVDTLKQQTDVRQVCLLGVRMGATLAVLASIGRDDVVGIAAIAPVVNARTYVRELRALALAGQGPPPPEWANFIPDLQESAGFVLTPSTCAALSGVDLLKQPAPAQHVLVIDRDDMPPNSAWVDHLADQGTAVEHVRMPGFTEMMLDSHETIVPEAMIASTVAWLGSFARRASATTTAGAPRRLPTVADAEFEVPVATGTPVKVRESTLWPDSNPTLFGIITEPVRGADRDAPLILLLNAGAVHHIGPNRMYVPLARSWAAGGATVLRMDISGLGDGAVHAGETENEVYTARAHQDIQAAITHMHSRNTVGPCHIIGLCSGAYNGFKFAASAHELASVVSINPLTFHWRPGMTIAIPEHVVVSEAMRYRRIMFQWESWKKMLTGGADLRELAHVLVRRGLAVARNAARNSARALRIPLPDDVGTDLQRVSKRRTDLLFVFAESDPGLELLRGEGGSIYERLLRRKSLRVEIVPGADHTFTAHWAREKLASILTTHIHGRKRPGR